MKLIDPSYKIIFFEPEKDVARICYAISRCYGREMPSSWDKRCDLIRRVRDKGHESVLEHSSMSVSFVVNRGVTHELVRHRHCGFTQESTRYCNYSQGRFDNQITYINNFIFSEGTKTYQAWIDGLQKSEDLYFELLNSGHTPEQARDILPNALKSEIVITTNFREWRSIFKLRCDSPAHYQMRQVMVPLFEEVSEKLPCVFDDIKL